MEKQFTILCVDDEAAILNSLKVELSTFFSSGFKIKTTNNGLDAIQLFADWIDSGIEIPLLITGCNIQGCTTNELMDRIKQKSSKTRIILLTGSDGATEVIKSTNQGTLYFFISKPWNTDNLSLIINNAIESYQQEVVIQSQNTALIQLNQSLEKKVIERTQELEKKNKELAKTNLQLKQTKSSLVRSEKMSSLGVMMAGIAHEINNPINFIYAGVGALKVAYERLSPLVQKLEEMTEENALQIQKEIIEIRENIFLDRIMQYIPNLIEDIESGAVRTIDIIKSLQNFSRDNNKIKGEIKIHEVIQSTLTLLGNKIKNNITILKNFEEQHLPTIEGYGGELNQVFMNLVSNAIQELDEKPKYDYKEIKISTKKLQKEVEISVRDNGRGIDEAIIANIFDPFFTTKDVGKGTGLGLSITFEIVERHKGTIKVNTQQGENSFTEFIIRLPYIYPK